jgi:hypothetical protein
MHGRTQVFSRQPLSEIVLVLWYAEFISETWFRQPSNLVYREDNGGSLSVMRCPYRVVGRGRVDSKPTVSEPVGTLA